MLLTVVLFGATQAHASDQRYYEVQPPAELLSIQASTNENALLVVNESFELPEPAVYIMSTIADAPCGLIWSQMERQGLIEKSDRGPSGSNEMDVLAPSPSCADLRDEGQTIVWDRANSPDLYDCRRINGSYTCLVFSHPLCDVGLSAGYGLVYLCAGGVFPDN